MSMLLPLLLTFVLVFVAFLGALSARNAVGVYRRLKRVPTAPVSKLAEGPAELAGRVLAIGTPLQTLDGTPAIAVRSEITTSYRSGSKTYSNPWALDATRAVRMELTDASGTCEIEADHLIPLGSDVSFEMSEEDLRTRAPDLWEAMTKSDGTITRVRIKQTFVPHDADVFVSGQATFTAPTELAEDYRSARDRFRVHGAEDRPLILSAWPEEHVRRIMLRPVALLTSASVLAVAVVGLLWFMRTYIGNVAGLP